MKKLFLSLPLLFLFLITTGCFDKDDSAENVGEKMDNVMEEGTEKMDNVMEEGAEKIEEAGDAVKEKIEN